MAQAIWTGVISFGLVAIPVKLYTAVRENGEIHFNFLHAKDQGKIHNERVCSVCGEKVAWKDVVRGYEHAKGDYVVLSPDELAKAAPKTTQAVDIVEFVDVKEIDPILFDKPYYLVPEKRGQHAYALLRDSLAKSGKVGIARVVMRTKEHLAALKPSGNALVLEMMHWSEEVVDPGEHEFPTHEELPARETKAASMLIDTMTTSFDVKSFRDRHAAQLREMLQARIEEAPAGRGKQQAEAGKAKILDLVDALKRSLDDTKAKAKSPAPRGPAGAGRGHRAGRASRKSAA